MLKPNAKRENFYERIKLFLEKFVAEIDEKGRIYCVMRCHHYALRCTDYGLKCTSNGMGCTNNGLSSTFASESLSDFLSDIYIGIWQYSQWFSVCSNVIYFIILAQTC